MPGHVGIDVRHVLRKLCHDFTGVALIRDQRQQVHLDVLDTGRLIEAGMRGRKEGAVVRDTIHKQSNNVR